MSNHGSSNGRAKLTEGQVQEIRKRLRRGDTLREIAADYRVHLNTIWNIRSGHRWGWLPQPARNDGVTLPHLPF